MCDISIVRSKHVMNWKSCYTDKLKSSLIRCVEYFKKRVCGKVFIDTLQHQIINTETVSMLNRGLLLTGLKV